MLCDVVVLLTYIYFCEQQEDPLTPAAENVRVSPEAGPSQLPPYQTTVTIEEVEDEDAPVTPYSSCHITFADVLFLTPLSHDVLFR